MDDSRSEMYRTLLLASSALAKARAEVDRALTVVNALLKSVGADGLPPSAPTDPAETPAYSPAPLGQRKMYEVCNKPGDAPDTWCDLWLGHEHHGYSGHYFSRPRRKAMHTSYLYAGEYNYHSSAHSISEIGLERG